MTTWSATTSSILLLSSLFLHSQATYLTSCNPLKETSCPSDPALGTDIALDFSSESSTMEYFDNYSGTGTLDYSSDDGLNLTLAKRFDNPSLKSKFYFMYGRVEAIVKAAPGTGIVSTIYLQSNDLDEIDWEWVGGDTTQVQTNFYSKGNTSNYDRGEYNNIDGNAITEYHNYTLDWQMSETNWYVDGKLVRNLQNTTSYCYPQTPMAIFLGVWAGGDPSNSEGTIEWAGGETDYSDAPFTMNVKSLKVADYSSGSEYSYNGTSGSWESIEVTGGSINGRLSDSLYLWDEASVSSTVETSSSTTDSISSASESTTSGGSSSSTTTLSITNSASSTSLSTTTLSLSSSPSSSSSFSSSLTTTATTTTSEVSTDSTSSSLSSSSETTTTTGTTSISVKTSKNSAEKVNFTLGLVLLSLFSFIY